MHKTRSTTIETRVKGSPGLRRQVYIAVQSLIRNVSSDVLKTPVIRGKHRSHDYAIKFVQSNICTSTEGGNTNTRVEFWVDKKPVFVEWDTLFKECEQEEDLGSAEGYVNWLLRYIDKLHPDRNYIELYESELNAAVEHISAMQDNLRKDVRFYELSRISSLPFKASVLTETLLYRTCELATAAIDLIRTERAIAAVILIRAIFENDALALNILDKIRAAIETKSTTGIDEYLMKAIHSNRKGGAPFTDYQSTSVLTLVEKVDKKFSGFQSMYCELCEYAHPNAQGVKFGYSQLDTSKKTEILGSDVSVRFLCEALNYLNYCLMIFRHYFANLRSAMPNLVEISENGVR